MIIAESIHACTIFLCVAVTSISVGIGQGLIGKRALQASDIQPNAKTDIFKAAIFGSAVSETSAIIGLTMALFLLGNIRLDTKTHWLMYCAELGIACAICLPGCVVGLTSSWPAQESCVAIARQPFFQEKIIRLMLLTQSIIQTPIIFGFIIAMLIKNHSLLVTTSTDTIRLIASGLCIGIASIGPTLGLAFFARTACRSLGMNRSLYNQLVSFTLVSQAIIETPIIFALVIALLLISLGGSQNSLARALATMLGSAFCMGMGTLGAGISSGKTAASACEKIAENPDAYPILSRLSMLGQGIIDTSAIYTFTIAMLLVFSN